MIQTGEQFLLSITGYKSILFLQVSGKEAVVVVVSSAVPAQAAQRERRQQLVTPLPASHSPLAAIDYFPYGSQAATATPTFHVTYRCSRRQEEAGYTETKGTIQHSGLHSENTRALPTCRTRPAWWSSRLRQGCTLLGICARMQTHFSSATALYPSPNSLLCRLQ